MTAPHEMNPSVNPAPEIAAAIPELRSERLTLRAPKLTDFPVLVEIDESVAEQSLRGTRSREDSWNEFTQMTATWIWRGHGWWTIVDADGVCGFIGLGFEPGDREPEFGYLLHESARRKGYATEAGRLVLGFARQAPLPSLVSYIAEHNGASQNVARKLGAARDSAAEAALGEDKVQVWRHDMGGAV